MTKKSFCWIIFLVGHPTPWLAHLFFPQGAEPRAAAQQQGLLLPEADACDGVHDQQVVLVARQQLRRKGGQANTKRQHNHQIKVCTYLVGF